MDAHILARNLNRVKNELHTAMTTAVQEYAIAVGAVVIVMISNASTPATAPEIGPIKTAAKTVPTESR